MHTFCTLILRHTNSNRFKSISVQFENWLIPYNLSVFTLVKSGCNFCKINFFDCALAPSANDISDDRCTNEGKVGVSVFLDGGGPAKAGLRITHPGLLRFGKDPYCYCKCELSAIVQLIVHKLKPGILPLPLPRPLRVFDPCGGAFVHTSAFRLTRDLSRWVTRAMFKRSDTFTQILVLIFSFKILLQPRPLFYDFPFSFLSQLNGKHNCQLNSEKTKMANIFKTCRI